MYCGKCGQKLSAQVSFCPKCGNKVNRQEKTGETLEEADEVTGLTEVIPETEYQKPQRKKWVLAVPVAVVFFAMVMLVSWLVRPSQKKVLKAYQEFYREYYQNNIGIDELYSTDDDDDTIQIEDLREMDCRGRIVMAPNGRLMLSIYDVTALNEKKYLLADVHLYSYERGKVVEKTVLRNIMSNNYIGYWNTDDELYFIHDSTLVERGIEFFSVYKYNKSNGKLEKDKWLKKDKKKKEEAYIDDIDEIDFENYETGSGVSAESIIFQMGYSMKGTDGSYQKLNCYSQWISGSAFEAVLDEMMEKKIKTPDQLLMFCGKKALEKYREEQRGKISDTEYRHILKHIVLIAKETEDAFYGISIQGEAALLYVKVHSKKNISALMQKVGDYKVTCVGNPYDDSYVTTFSECEGLAIIKIPDNITYMSRRAFFDCKSLLELEIPDSVADIARDSIPESVLIFCGRGSFAEKYAIENGLLYVNGTIDSADESEVERVKQEMRRYALEKEDSESHSDDEYDDGYDEY